MDLDDRGREMCFQVLWSKMSSQGSWREVYEDILRRYSESQRAYHSIGHLDDVLNEFAMHSNLAEDPLAVELALWYHDEQARKNLRRSIAQLF